MARCIDLQVGDARSPPTTDSSLPLARGGHRSIDGAPHAPLQLFSEIVPRFGVGDALGSHTVGAAALPGHCAPVRPRRRAAHPARGAADAGRHRRECLECRSAAAPTTAPQSRRPPQPRRRMQSRATRRHGPPPTPTADVAAAAARMSSRLTPDTAVVTRATRRRARRSPRQRVDRSRCAMALKRLELRVAESRGLDVVMTRKRRPARCAR
jgi:hypothetical protein